MTVNTKHWVYWKSQHEHDRFPYDNPDAVVEVIRRVNLGGPQEVGCCKDFDWRWYRRGEAGYDVAHYTNIVAYRILGD